MKLKVLAILTTLALAPVSQAALIAFSGVNVPIPTTFSGVYVDLVNNTTSTAPAAGAHLNLFFGGAGLSNDADAGAVVPSLQFLRVGTANNDAARNSPLGTVIDASSPSYSTGFGSSGSPNTHLGVGAPSFIDGTIGYLGFTFDLSGTPVYGFAEVTLTANGAGVLHGWAYEDTGAPITITSPVPEPSAGLLALVSAGVLAMRRRR